VIISSFLLQTAINFSRLTGFFSVPATFSGQWGDINLLLRNITTVPRKPAQSRHQLRCQFYAFRIDRKSVLINAAQTGFQIEIPASSHQVENSPLLILDLFKTALTTAATLFFPFIF
jgi:hypothetical protein